MKCQSCLYIIIDYIRTQSSSWLGFMNKDLERVLPTFAACSLVVDQSNIGQVDQATAAAGKSLVQGWCCGDMDDIIFIFSYPLSQLYIHSGSSILFHGQ